jgi:uncharacterized protein (TIGR03437 family)
MGMNRLTRLTCSLSAAVTFTLGLALAQTTTPITLENISGSSNALNMTLRPVSANGTGAVNPFGSAAVSFSGIETQNAGTIQGTFTFFFNRVDSFNVTASPQMVGKTTNLTSSGSIAGGTGAYSGATGSVTYTFTYTASSSSAGAFTLTGSGSITVGATTTAITLAGFSGPASVANATSGTILAQPTGSVSPFGNVTATFSGMSTTVNGAPGPVQGTFVFALNTNDSFFASFAVQVSYSSQSMSVPCTITGGTGVFHGATGTLNATFTLNNDGTFALTGSGMLIQPAPGIPTIAAVVTAFGGSTIAQNDFIVITGTNLVPAGTPAAGVIWSTAPSFVNGLMPTQLGGVSVTVNSKPAFVYFYCSAATDPACPLDQLNILTPLDNTTGPVPVVLTSGSVSYPPIYVNLQPVAPSLLLFSPNGYVVATHLNGSLLGPIGLYTTSTPAKPGEQVVLYAIGFGLPATPLVNGSAVQSASLALLPSCQVGGTAAGVVFAGLITPGLYQLNVNLPSTLANGDNAISCSYGGSSTPPGNLITVQR